MDILTYNIGGVMYVNLTNRCSNDCTFCERTRVSNMGGYNLWLDKEPSAEDIISELKGKDLDGITELVFCGWGEPTYRFDVIKQVSSYAHIIGLNTRVNTNGQGSLIAGYDISSEVADCLDKVSISLNASCAQEYQSVCRSEYGESAYGELLDFAAKCHDRGVHVTLSVVDLIGESEVEACRKIANSIGVQFRVRPEIK